MITSPPSRSSAAAIPGACGTVMGPLLSHISTTDTVRDLNRLREVGEDKLTYGGLSYGQLYANMFPEHVRAMMLDGIVYPPDFVTSAETRSSTDASSTDEVFQQFLTLCDQAGPDKCALAGHGETAAARVARLFAQVQQAPIPAPNANPPCELLYSDLKVSDADPVDRHPVRPQHQLPERRALPTAARRRGAADP